MKSWLPTRKWLAALAVGAGGIATSAVESGWDATEWKLCIALAVQALTTYLVSNESTPGGVPLRVAGDRGVSDVGLVMLLLGVVVGLLIGIYLL
jgi:hypothetical protein